MTSRGPHDGSACRPGRAALALVSLTALLAALPVAAREVPAQLPDPDGKPGDPTKPVKVYILAGQSNMVGMGEISGARCPYTGIYLTADPAAPKGPLPIWPAGNYKIAPFLVRLPDGTPTDKPVAQGQLEVPEKGVYRVQCGSGKTSYCTMELAGKQVYRRTPGGEPSKQGVSLEPGRRYPFKISGFEGEPPRFWMQKMDLLGRGDLEAVVKREGKFPWLIDDKGNWTVRHDVYFQEARVAKEGRGSPLSATSNGRTIGPELGFGYVMGTYHDEQVLLIKTAMGNRSLGFDFRPPSSGRTDPANKWESLEYKLMLEGVRKTLDNIARIVPGYKGQGYEIAGFVWWQGHKDSFSEKLIAEYENNLVNLINDVRKEFKAPKLPVVIATVGFGGRAMPEKFRRIWQAQMAVADPKKHPEFAGTVATVDTRDFWRQPDQSPRSQDYHYNRNAETYMLVGDALGRAMVGLLEGRKPKAAPPPPFAPPRVAQRREQTDEEKAKAQAALAPIILDGIIPQFVATHRDELLRAAKAEKPKRPTQFLRDTLDALVALYRAIGIKEYDWHLFGPDLKNLEWNYYSFDPPEKLPSDSPKPRFRKVTYPRGSQNWFAPDFDPKKAGWKCGLPPFGQLGGKLLKLREDCTMPWCLCGVTPRTLWEKEVLLLRGTFEFPPLEQGHRYRIVVGGSCHVNAGEGFAIYINGRKLFECPHGVYKRQGGQPRGAFITRDFFKDFHGGKVTIAATSFLRYYHPRQKDFPPRGHITLWLEEMKLPPPVQRLVAHSTK